MSIKEACYKLSKEIWKLEIREDIKNIIHSMNFIPKDSTEEQRQYSNYAYVSKHQKAQFMGYLIVDYKKDLLTMLFALRITLVFIKISLFPSLY